MGSTRHPEPAALHALARGEIDPAERAVLERHVDDCAACRRQLTRIGHLGRVMLQISPKGLDDVAWQRMAVRVRTELESNAHDRLASRPTPPWSWIGGAVAAAAAVAAAVWLWPTPADHAAPNTPTAAPSSVAARSNAATLSTNDVPLELDLPKGPKLRLARQSKMKLRTDGPHVGLEIESGELSVAAPTSPGGSGEVRVKAPGVVAVARESDFSIAYRGSQVFVDVRHGEVQVTGDALEGTEVLRDGENIRVKNHANEVVQRGRGVSLDQVLAGAREALVRGDHARAEAEGERVLASWPNDTERQAALMLVLEATVASGALDRARVALSKLGAQVEPKYLKRLAELRQKVDGR